jgi:hypothetical protein
MIHAFLITIAVLFAIQLFPLIATLVAMAFSICCSIIKSKWFWLGILFIALCCFIGPLPLVILAGLWIASTMGGLFKTRGAYRREFIRNLEANPSDKAAFMHLVQNRIDRNNAIAARSDSIDWSKLR